MRPSDLPEILKEARELSQYCGRVMLIPKCKVPLPTDFQHWLAFSIPTSYGGTDIEPEWFGDRPVHLLGGSPTAQHKYYQKLQNVVSVDGNYAMKLSAKGKSCWRGNSTGTKARKGCYESFRLSLLAQKEDWRDCLDGDALNKRNNILKLNAVNYWNLEWRWEDEPLAKFANQIY